MAKPSPCVGTPCGVNAIFAEALPTSRPERSITGPPLFPGLIAASVCTKSLYSVSSTVMLRIDFDGHQSGLVVAGNVMSAGSLAIVCGDVNLQVRRPLDHVLVRYDITGRIDDETGAETLQGLTDFAWPNPIIAEELRIEIVNRVAHSASN